jgi:SAM-dependent methyltransferase
MTRVADDETMDTKQAREREFHNAVFTDGRRGGPAIASGAYAILHDSRIFYEGFIKTHAPGARMLEFGCGASAMASTFGASAAQVFGIDISDVAVQQASDRAAAAGLNATYRVMDAEALNFPDRSFDLICSAAILHHLDLNKAYAEIARTLTPGGHAIFMEPLAYNPVINLYRRMTPNLRTPDEHPLRLEDLELASTYFDGVEVRYYSLATLLAIPLRGRRGFLPTLFGLERLDRTLFRAVPWLRKYAWQVVIVLSRPKRA